MALAWIIGYRSAHSPRTSKAAGTHAARCWKKSASLPDELRESSGLAVSRTQPGVLWSHNDSGDGPNLYAIDMSGRLLARIQGRRTRWRVTGRTSRQARVPAAMAPQNRPAVGMSLHGRHGRQRSGSSATSTIYVFVEPRIGGLQPASTVTARSLQLSLPEQARPMPRRSPCCRTATSPSSPRDAGGRSTSSAFRLTPSPGRLHPVTPSRRDSYGNTGILPNQRTGRLVTGRGRVARRDDAGRSHLLRGVLLRACERGRREPLARSATAVCPWRRRAAGEAIDYLDANTLLLTSERSRGRPGTIHRLQC